MKLFPATISNRPGAPGRELDQTAFRIHSPLLVRAEATSPGNVLSPFEGAREQVRFRTRPSRPLFYLPLPRLFPTALPVPRNLHIRSPQWNHPKPSLSPGEQSLLRCLCGLATTRIPRLARSPSVTSSRAACQASSLACEYCAASSPATLDMLTTVPRFFLIAVSVCCYFLWRNKKRDAKEAAAVRDWNDA